jgi:Uma2 family endonuclease
MMATASVTIEPETGIEADDLYRISLDVYREMGEQGLLLPDDRVELLDGLLVKKMTKRPRHTTVTHRIFRRLDSALPAGWYARMEQPIELPGGPAGDSAPEPDIAVVEGDLEDYATRHPGPAEVALVVEVARDSKALRRDRQGLKRYAWARIPTVWIVNLTNDTVEVYTEPSRKRRGPAYGKCEFKKPGEIATIVLGDTVVEIPVSEIVR